MPIERENVSNPLNERKIIRSSLSQYKTEAENLPPLLFAGIVPEGGIVSYDANTITGGAGVRFFGTGGSSQYRQDRVTVYLRAVATKSGKILKTVYTSKTLLSQAVDAGMFRYVRFKRLLEVETGYATNEPAQMAVTEAIEKAVQSLIVEGIQDSLWTVNEKAAGQTRTMLADYAREKEAMSQTDVCRARNTVEPSRLTIHSYASAWQYRRHGYPWSPNGLRDSRRCLSVQVPRHSGERRRWNAGQRSEIQLPGQHVTGQPDLSLTSFPTE